MTSHSELDNTPQESLGGDYKPADYMNGSDEHPKTMVHIPAETIFKIVTEELGRMMQDLEMGRADGRVGLMVLNSATNNARFRITGRVLSPLYNAQVADAERVALEAEIAALKARYETQKTRAEMWEKRFDRLLGTTRGIINDLEEFNREHDGTHAEKRGAIAWMVNHGRRAIQACVLAYGRPSPPETDSDIPF